MAIVEVRAFRVNSVFDAISPTRAKVDPRVGTQTREAAQEDAHTKHSSATGYERTLSEGGRSGVIVVSLEHVSLIIDVGRICQASLK